MLASLRGLNLLTTARDSSLGLLLFLTILLMVLPLPSLLVDLLISLNFALAIMILMTSVYLRKTLDLSSLPGIILIATLFRLALSVTTTRLILAEGDAGAIIQTFGEFVIAGNVVVGLVVFFIITVVQFMVIAKGSERIAEVAARFTLDAMPGKQMAIDAELRGGDIDAAEANRRREILGQESQFFGAMDGAMKFVKGDAVAGLVIIFVNLIGGFTIGVAQLGMSAGDAMQTYALLSVGDALISQIPALLISLAAASTVTRVQGRTGGNMAAEIVSQLGADPRGMKFAALALLGLGIVPGFPTVVMVVLAAVLFGGATYLSRKAKALKADATSDDVSDTAEDGAPAIQELPETADFQIDLAPDLEAVIDPVKFAASVEAARYRIAQRFGVGVPPVGLRKRAGTGAETVFALEETPLAWCDIAADQVEILIRSADARRILGPDTKITETKLGIAVDFGAAEALASSGAQMLTPQTRLEIAFEDALVNALPRFIGIQEARDFLEEVQESHGALVDEVTSRVTTPQLADVLQALLAERIALLPRRILLEALAKYGAPAKDSGVLVDELRGAMRQQISHKVADAMRRIPVLVVEDDVADTLRRHLHRGPDGVRMILPPDMADHIHMQITEALRDACYKNAKRPVILAADDIRRYLADYLRRRKLEIGVLSDSEVADDYIIQPIEKLSLTTERRTTFAAN